jgi:hypothetical protein
MLYKRQPGLSDLRIGFHSNCANRQQRYPTTPRQIDQETRPPGDAAMSTDLGSQRVPNALALPARLCQGRTGKRDDIRQHNEPDRLDHSSNPKQV